MIVSKDFHVGFRMVDGKLRIKNGEILNTFVDVAGVHSERVGDGFGKTDSRWILIGYNVKIFDKPKYGEDVTFVTWSREHSPAIATREFEIRSKDGKLLVCALSNFVKYDIVTRKLQKITKDLMQAYESEPEKSNFGGAGLERFKEPELYEGYEDFFVDWRWIDLNGHMNNSHYVELAERVIHKRFNVDVSNINFNVLYKHEIPENTAVRAFFAETPDYYTVSIKSLDEKVLHGAVTFKKI